MTSSPSLAKMLTNFIAFSMIGSCDGLSAPNNSAISSTSNNHNGIFKTSVSLKLVLVVYALKLISGLILSISLKAL